MHKMNRVGNRKTGTTETSKRTTKFVNKIRKRQSFHVGAAESRALCLNSNHSVCVCISTSFFFSFSRSKSFRGNASNQNDPWGSEMRKRPKGLRFHGLLLAQFNCVHQHNTHPTKHLSLMLLFLYITCTCIYVCVILIHCMGNMLLKLKFNE